MEHKHSGSDDPKSLSRDAARRLLTRASEIDLTKSDELPLADLREASFEAGIAPTAFEQALLELHGNKTPVRSNSNTPASALGRRLSGALLSSAKTVGLVLATLLVVMLLIDLL
jgi:hypothetical protein